MHTSFALSARLSTDGLMDIAMDVARGRSHAVSAARYAGLVRAARAFALIAEPRGKPTGVFGGVSVTSSLDGIRTVVAMERDGATITVSGPHGAAIAWCVDRIDATEEEALAMLSDAAMGWPSKPNAR